MLAYCLEKIEELAHIDEVYIVTNNKFASHFEERLPSYDWRLHIKVLNDGTLSNDDRLWALGDIQFVLDNEWIDDDLLILWWDNLFEDTLLWLYELFVEKKSSCISSYDIGDVARATQFGVLEVDEDAKVLTFSEKPADPVSSLVSTLIYFITKQDVATIQACIDAGKKDNPWFLIQALVEWSTIYSLPISWYRYDIGNKDQLQEVRATMWE